MPARVVDASVLRAIIYGESRAEEADALLRGSELYAPVLLAYELTHVAQKKARQHPALRGVLEGAFQAALSLDIRWQEVDHPAVLHLALETGLTTYDASYLYLSRSLGLGQVTFGERSQQVD